MGNRLQNLTADLHDRLEEGDLRAANALLRNLFTAAPAIVKTVAINMRIIG